MYNTHYDVYRPDNDHGGGNRYLTTVTAVRD